MKLNYHLSIPNPENHLVHITIDAKRSSVKTETLDFFMPGWSPGSYLMREYGRNIKGFRAFNKLGERLDTAQVDKGIYKVNFKTSDLKHGDELEFKIYYEVYCHELTVRTSHVDITHAFIHGPSVFMGVLGEQMLAPELTIQINPMWSKITTGLKDISNKRDLFLYTAKDYDEFIDAPIEIGCHETDGFLVDGIPHELAFYGSNVKGELKTKEDIKKIVTHIQKSMGGMPYDRYVFITHLAPKLFGGLEHLNSTALQYCSYQIDDEKGYKEWLELVAHEYFHLWNVKRIRPVELGPFDYLKEALTKMHWLTEGLTSFMDQFFIYRTDFYSTSEYLDCIKANINRYISTPGRKYHSAEESSMNAWIKLYRPDENSNNSSVSYYLKGGLIFFLLHTRLLSFNKSVLDLVGLLWEAYKKSPEVGFAEEVVYNFVEQLSDKKTRDEFEYLIKGVEEIDFESYLATINIAVEYETAKADLGINPDFIGDRVIVKSVVEEASAYRSGLNAGDEIISVNGLRFLKSDYDSRDKIFKHDGVYNLFVSRLGVIRQVTLHVGLGIRKIKSLKVKEGVAEKDFEKLFKGALPN